MTNIEECLMIPRYCYPSRRPSDYSNLDPPHPFAVVSSWLNPVPAQLLTDDSNSEELRGSQQKNDQIIRQLWPLVILAIIMAFKLITLPIASKMSGMAGGCQRGQSWGAERWAVVPISKWSLLFLLVYCLSLSPHSCWLSVGKPQAGGRGLRPEKGK